MKNQQGAPEALRPITRYEVVDCIDSKHVPAVIPNKDGPWVRYEDHIAALVEAQQPAPSAAAARALTDGQRALHEVILNRLSHAELLEKAHYLMELNSNQARMIVAASRWAHDDRAGLRATLRSVRGSRHPRCVVCSGCARSVCMALWQDGLAQSYPRVPHHGNWLLAGTPRKRRVA